MLQQKKYMTLNPAPQSVTGLALSGGGLRAIGHIGVLKALEQHGIRASVVSGTSAGAVVGAFYAAGFTPDDMFSIIHKTDFFPKSYFRLRTNGLFSAAFLEKLFSQFLPSDFSGLKLPLWVAATELTAGVTEFFHEGDLYKALLASSSIPFVLPAVHDGNKMYMDGGILNNLPIEPLRDKCDYLIGVHVNAISHEQPIGFRQTFDRVFHLALSNAVYAKAAQCNLFLDPPDMIRYSLMDKKDAQQIFDHTYSYAMRQLEIVRAGASPISQPVKKS